MRRPSSRTGFTLVELLVVIAMLAILAGTISSAVVSAMRQSKIAKATTEVRELTNAILAYENTQKDHKLPALGGVDASESSLAFLLGGSGAGEDKKTIPVLFNASLRNGKIYDPWGTPYRVLIKAGQEKIEDHALDSLTAATFIPNYYRLNADEEGATKNE